ncbi:MAG: DUF6036 family nucleotidyltransferase [Pyrinomonadaceae bacterium]
MTLPANDLIPIRILHEFTARLESLGVRYMLTGSMAMFAYSIYRYTADIDIVLDLASGQVSRLVEAFEQDYYIARESAYRAVASERMFNVINIATGFKVDCVIRKSNAFQKNAFNRRRPTMIADQQIYVITLEDLILSKLIWASPSRSEKQMTDISNLLLADIDTEYLDSWAAKLEVRDLLNECRADLES